MRLFCSGVPVSNNLNISLFSKLLEGHIKSNYHFHTRRSFLLNYWNKGTVPSLRVEVEKKLPPLRLEVFDIVCLIEDEEIPLFGPEGSIVLYNQLVTRDTHMECVGFGPAHSFLSSLFLGAVVRHNLKQSLVSLSSILFLKENLYD